mgnify:CR=1 FL=1
MKALPRVEGGLPSYVPRMRWLLGRPTLDDHRPALVTASGDRTSYRDLRAYVNRAPRTSTREAQGSSQSVRLCHVVPPPTCLAALRFGGGAAALRWPLLCALHRRITVCPIDPKVASSVGPLIAAQRLLGATIAIVSPKHVKAAVQIGVNDIFVLSAAEAAASSSSAAATTAFWSVAKSPLPTRSCVDGTSCGSVCVPRAR